MLAAAYPAAGVGEFTTNNRCMFARSDVIAPTSLNRRLLLALVILLAPSFATHAASDDPWTRALVKRDLATIERLVEQGADVSRAAEDGYTALMLAANEHQPSLVRTLLERGARIDAVNRRGGTALMYAAAVGDRETVELLFARGASVNVRAANGWTALTLASARGFDTVVTTLLLRDADPNIADIYGWTPLMRAVEQNRPAATRALLASGRVDANARDENGHTALHHAAVQGLTEIARMLVEHGADVQIRDRGGRTPGMLAVAQGHEAIAEIIQRAAMQ